MPRFGAHATARIAVLAGIVLASALVAGPVMSKSEKSGDPLTDRMNHLGGQTLSRLASRGKETTVVSPYGLGSALHLLSFGAGGSAAQSLRGKLLRRDVTVGQQRDGMIKLQRRLHAVNSDKLKLTTASAVFVPKSARPSSSFVAAALAVFDAPVEAVDFRSTATVQRINAWAGEASHGLIPRVVERLDPAARFVVANIVYFNGAWKTAFDVANTTKAPFTRADGSTRDVAMMDATTAIEFAEFEGLQAVWLPYDGNEVAMLVIAPGEAKEPSAVRTALQRRALTALMVAAEQKRRVVAAVQVRVPRFRVESNLDMTGILAGQGLAPALSAHSDYNAINRAKGGSLVVVHRAVLDVTETGTKAAAATSVTTDRSLEQPPVFSADRPFAIAIIHRDTRAVLFAGYIADPGDDPGVRPTESRVTR